MNYKNNICDYDYNSETAMTRDQVRDFDAWAISEMNIPGCVLMENAGLNSAKIILEHYLTDKAATVAIFCGTGNNGGDGYVIARHLCNAGQKVKVAICGEPSRIKGDALLNLNIIKKMNITIETIDPSVSDTHDRAKQFAANSQLIIDALFGTGLTGPMRSGYPAIIRAINEADIPVIAVDIPSGLDCDQGMPTNNDNAVKAETTVTFAAMKKGFLIPTAKKYTGKITVASIGIEPSAR